MSDLKNAENARVAKTRDAIFRAFAQLVSEKESLYNISITELTQRANINRATFYLHYKTILDVVSDIENSIAEELERTSKQYSIAQLREDMSPLIERMAELLSVNPLISKLFLSSEGTRFVMSLYEAFNEIIHEKELEETPTIDNIQDTQLRTACSFIVSGVVSAYKEWFNDTNPNKAPMETVTKTLCYIVNNGIKQFLIY